eukprot:CAMPEP_0178503784 /NCGR_PEP_ID=MMETSP0696-20121128/18229_1 /TAXON_ID=265572 /ORGANISM="Extubocellulus spinifer, Strain CCMP396" /LENGTH=162 /DNA_ID=CAMNT_0020132945 /DNA_START=311 /DNA_END=796 /DNA_ORIENTATION=+
MFRTGPGRRGPPLRAWAPPPQIVASSSARGRTVTTNAAEAGTGPSVPPSATAASGTVTKPPPSKPPPFVHLFIKAGLPLVLFSVGASYVLKNAIEGKNKERDVYKGVSSKSERQARVEKDHDAMLEKINKKMAQDFDNTRRIERPEEVLERRKRERERRNVW